MNPQFKFFYAFLNIIFIDLGNGEKKWQFKERDKTSLGLTPEI